MLGDKINKECLDCVSRLLVKVLKQKQELEQAIENCLICKKWDPATCPTHWQRETKLPCRQEIEHLENIKSNLIFLKKMKDRDYEKPNK